MARRTATQAEATQGVLESCPVRTDRPQHFGPCPQCDDPVTHVFRHPPRRGGGEPWGSAGELRAEWNASFHYRLEPCGHTILGHQIEIRDYHHDPNIRFHER